MSDGGAEVSHHHQTVLDIQDQTCIEMIIHEDNTIWHHFNQLFLNARTAKRCADSTLRAAQSKCGVITGIIFVLLYMFGLYTFDRGLFGLYSVVYSVLILLLTLPGSILYFGTLNAPICVSIMKSGTFWFKLYNVALCNLMSIIWAYHNLPFDVLSKPKWFTIYGMYFAVNLLTASMGCLLDGFRWSRWLKILGPLLLALYFGYSSIYWHYLHCNTMLKFAVFGYRKDLRLTNVASNAAFNAALFFFGQSFHTFWYRDQSSILSTTARLTWVRH